MFFETFSQKNVPTLPSKMGETVRLENINWKQGIAWNQLNTVFIDLILKLAGVVAFFRRPGRVIYDTTFTTFHRQVVPQTSGVINETIQDF